MTEEDKQHFEDLLIKAVQSGKNETSDLVDHILHKIAGHIELSIDKNVNGKIDKLTKMQEEQNKVLESMQIDINLLKQDTTPLVNQSKEKDIIKQFLGNMGTSVVKVGAVLTAIGIIGGITGLILKIILLPQLS